MVYEYSIPGILHLVVQTFPAGTADQCDRAPPPEDLPPLRTTYSAQAVTPIDEGQARYLFSTGFPKPAPAKAVDFLMDVTLAAFAEDKEMIEAQQRVIDLDPSRRPMPTAADKGVTLFTRLVDRLAKAEDPTEALAAGDT
jgi:vanillate O-demethylase monooxygenase subunit